MFGADLCLMLLSAARRHSFWHPWGIFISWDDTIIKVLSPFPQLAHLIGAFFCLALGYNWHTRPVYPFCYVCPVLWVDTCGWPCQRFFLSFQGVLTCLEAPDSCSYFSFDDSLAFRISKSPCPCLHAKALLRDAPSPYSGTSSSIYKYVFDSWIRSFVNQNVLHYNDFDERPIPMYKKLYVLREIATKSKLKKLKFTVRAYFWLLSQRGHIQAIVSLNLELYLLEFHLYY